MNSLLFPSRGLSFIRLTLYLALLFGAKSVFAQVGVPIRITVDGQGSDPGELNIMGTFLPSTPTGTDTFKSVSKYPNYSDWSESVTVGTVRVEVGKTYTVLIGGANYLYGTATVQAPQGYNVIMNGLRRTSASVEYNVDITLQPMNQHPGLAGMCSDISGVGVFWSLALGNLYNGSNAGELSLADAALGSSWSTMLDMGVLSCDSSCEDVHVYRGRVGTGPEISDITTHQIGIAISQSNNFFGKGLYIQCYSPGNYTSPAPGFFPVYSGSPYLYYMLALTSSTSMTITRATSTRTESTTLTRTGSWPAYQWVKSDWTVSGGSCLRQITTQSAGVTGGRTEAITVKVPGGSSVYNLVRTYTDTAAGQMLTGESAGTSNSLTAAFDYYTNIAYYSDYGRVKSVALPNGGWVAYEYYSIGQSAPGSIKYQFKPYLDSPSSVSFTQGQGEITYYEYNTNLDQMPRPSLIETKVNGVTTAKRTIAYTDTIGTYPYQTEAVSTLYTSSGATLQTVNRSWRKEMGQWYLRGLPTLEKTAEGVVKVWDYEPGNWSGTAFTPSGSGSAVRTSVYVGVGSSSSETLSSATFGGTIPLYVVPGKSTKEVSIRDTKARIVRTESYVYAGGAWQATGYVNYTYDSIGLLLSKVDDKGRQWTSTYVGMLKETDTDENGVTTSYGYDAAGRIATESRSGYAGISATSTSYSYDAAHHVLSKTRKAWGSTEQIVTSTSYDDAGRVSTETPPGLSASSHAYNVSSRTHTVTRPDGSTVIDQTYRDGRLASRTGTGVVPEYFTFGTETDGRTWSRVDKGSSSSARWQTSWTDWLGRALKAERPGYTGQSNSVEESFYDTSTGQLNKTTKTGYAPTRFTYDLMGRPKRSGLDVDDNGLVLASNDRITETNQYAESYSSAYWLRTEESKYTVSGNATGTVTSIKRQRLTGFPSNRISEVQMTDVEGNVTVETVDLDRTLHTAVKTTTRVGVANAQVQVVVHGFPIRTLDFDGLTTTQAYDALLRPSKTTDSRGNASTTAYYSGTELKETVKDGTNQTVVSFGYDTSGRVVWQADAQSNLTRTSYTARGQAYRQWGGGTYPVEYGYDSTYGDRTTQSTFRGGASWDGSSWPGSPGTADTTTFAYDAPSGLLTSKTDAASKSSLYTYNVRGQLATREWQRLVTSGGSTGQRVKTTYTYSSTTGEQIAIAYNDNLTTGLTYTYNRMGQAETITDATGSRALEYCTPCGTVLSETFDSTYFGGRKITYKRDQSTTGRLGQGIGYKLGTASALASDQEVTYGYENLNRFTALMSGFANNSSSRTFRYGYEPDSFLLKTLTVDDSPFMVNRTYEDDRDFVTAIETKGNSPLETYAKYEYTYDTRGYRATALQSGTAFADYGDSTYYRYSYNGRGELTAALEYMGTNVSLTTNYLPGRQFEYAYDNIGNRQWSNRTGVTGLRDDYTANALNQYTGRENNTVSVSGTATSDSIVAVNGRNVTAGRRGKFWSDEVTVANVLTPWRGPLSVYAAKPSGGNHLLRYDSRTAQIPAISETLTYDLDGNPTSDGFWDYKWDAENRLIRLETNSTARSNGVPWKILEFQYDYLGRRVQKRAIDGNLSQEFSCRRYLYQGWNVIAEYAAPGGSSFGALIRTYTWGLDIARSLADAGGVGALVQIADHATGKAFLPAYDGNGNVTAMVNAGSGALAAAYEYTPYGEVLRADVFDTTIADQPFRFSTKWTDDESGLVYYGRRYYDPRNGRFVGRDPIDEDGGLNLYGFLANNTINRWDYIGMDMYLTQVAGGSWCDCGDFSISDSSSHGNQLLSNGIPVSYFFNPTIFNFFFGQIQIPNRVTPPTIRVDEVIVWSPQRIAKIEQEMNEYGINYKEVSLADDIGGIPNNVEAYQVTNGLGGTRSKFNVKETIVSPNTIFGEDVVPAILAHEADHIQRIQNAKLKILTDEKTDGRKILISGKSQTALEYFGNKAAVEFIDKIPADKRSLQLQRYYDRQKDQMILRLAEWLAFNIPQTPAPPVDLPPSNLNSIERY